MRPTISAGSHTRRVPVLLIAWLFWLEKKRDIHFIYHNVNQKNQPKKEKKKVRHFIATVYELLQNKNCVEDSSSNNNRENVLGTNNPVRLD